MTRAEDGKLQSHLEWPNICLTDRYSRPCLFVYFVQGRRLRCLGQNRTIHMLFYEERHVITSRSERDPGCYVRY